MTTLHKLTNNILNITLKVSSASSVHKFHCSPIKYETIQKWYQKLWIPRRTEAPYSHITQVGDPILRNKSDPVPAEAITSNEIKFLIQKMTEVLHKYDCVGLAAPQIGIPLRVILMELSDRTIEKFSTEKRNARQMKKLPLTVLINPEIKVTNFNKKIFVEACESVRGYSAEVARYEEVTVKAFDANGKEQELQLKGWAARIAQHEMDHINGIVYTDVMNKQSFTCTCWQAVNSREGRIYIKFDP